VGLTLCEKILASHGDGRDPRPGDLLTCSVDRTLATDVTAPLAIEAFRAMGAERVHDPSSCILVNDHFVPARDIRAAEAARAMRDFASEQGIGLYFEVGRSGICHALVAEECLALPGQILVGADSHTCTAGAFGSFAVGVGATDLAAVWALGETWMRVPATIRVEWSGRREPFVDGKDLALRTVCELGVEGGAYRALEFGGETVAELPMNERFTLCNMSIETGAKAGLIGPDEVTRSYLTERAGVAGEWPVADEDAEYERTVRLSCRGLSPQVAAPFLPSNVEPVDAFTGVRVDQVVIGSCTNGSIEDMRKAAGVLSGRRVAAGVRCIVVPASQRCFRMAAEEGLLAGFAESGAHVVGPTCGPCLGGHSGVLGPGETAVTTTNRNFRGRMGDVTSRVYLANPFVAAAAAVAGTIVHPGDMA